MAPGTDSWTTGFFSVAALFILWKAWRGWRLGLVRQGVGVLALIGAYFAAIFGGDLLTSTLRPLGLPDFLLNILGGALLSGAVFFSSMLLGAILFKKTSDQSVVMIRLGYGASGALLGMAIGIFFVVVAMLGVRFLGTLAEADLALARHPLAPLAGRPAPEIKSPGPAAWVQGIADLKAGLEESPVGGLVERLDPIPESAYTILSKIGKMTAQENAVRRFLTYPGVKALVEHPKFTALQGDPDFVPFLEKRDYLGLMRSPRLLGVVNDSELRLLFQQLDLEKALDYALEEPGPRPGDGRVSSGGRLLER